MIAWDISAGAGVSLIDPHGQLVEDILDHHIPRSRTDDVIYFNPKDSRWRASWPSAADRSCASEIESSGIFGN